MALDVDRVVEHLHGHAGWLAAAVLVHPAIVLRRASRRAHAAVVAATAVVTLVCGAGAWLYVDYIERLRQATYRDGPAFGRLFERKEHLAFAACMLAWAGAAAYFAAGRAAPGSATRASLRKAAHLAFCASAAAAVVVAAFGTIIAAFKSF